MESFNKQTWEDLNLTTDELKNIGEALQKEEFRSLLLDYVKEINDPENRKQYEKEITQLENERGVDIKFVHPSSGYVIKTSVDGKEKAFINICSNKNVGEPLSTPDVEKGHQGLRWSVPYCLAPPREDIDKKSKTCTVYDVVFHPKTLQMAKNNAAFKKLVNDTALSAVEENFNVLLDKINLKFPKMLFKGSKHATVIRKKMSNYNETEYTDIPNYPYPPLKEDKPDSASQKQQNAEQNISTKDVKYTTPNYKIIHRKTVDMQDYTNDPMSKMSITVPNELVVAIDLPLLKCSTDASIDVTENTLYLVSEKPVKYRLKLNLPYSVDSNKGTAKFDTIKRTLTVTLPVVKLQSCSNLDLAREDSGVESDNCYGRTNSISSGDEDGIESDSVIDVPDEGAGHFESKTEICISTAQKFLKSNVHYVLPNFTCQLLKDVLTFTLQVPNVNPESVQHKFFQNSSGYHLSFLSMGAGFFPVYYAFCVLLPSQNKVENESFSVEVWDNNVIAQIKLTSCDIQVSEYLAGVDENSVEKYVFSNPESQCKSNEKDDNKTAESVEVETIENTNSNEDDFQTPNCGNKSALVFLQNETNGDQDGILTCCTTQAIECHPEENEENLDARKINSDQNESAKKFLEQDRDFSISESASSFDESTSSPQRHSAKSRTVSESQQGERIKSRGILKIGRSLSESSVDDYASWSAEKIEKTKKTVRFSEIISKQTFRMNSSILGQRKKNQRKTRNKKRAQERRLSESGGESEGENEVALIKEKKMYNIKEMDIWLKEPESSSCDVSEVSEVSDISESDDGQKEETKPSLPCSSRKNHKRRGKKSARKNAATAKLQFMDN